jgi:hypothetical protein
MAVVPHLCSSGAVEEMCALPFFFSQNFDGLDVELVQEFVTGGCSSVAQHACAKDGVNTDKHTSAARHNNFVQHNGILLC